MISVIIPVLNEKKHIGMCIDSIRRQTENYEIIMVVSERGDDTISIIEAINKKIFNNHSPNIENNENKSNKPGIVKKRFNTDQNQENKIETKKKQNQENNLNKTVIKNKKIKIISAKKGKAQQLNAGARLARGDILLFLHADTQLHQESFSHIEHAVRDGFIGGGFLQQFKENAFLLRLVSMRSNARSYMTRIFFGDQGIFVRRDIFDKMSGFACVPIMEDLDFSRQMKREGKVKIIKKKITVSGRKYLENGILKLTLVYFVLMVLYHSGVDFKRIKKLHDSLL